MRTIVDADPAGWLARDLVAFLNACGDAHIAVSGGSTPRALFRILASEFHAAVAWDRVTIWQVDERCVPPDDPQSNWKMLSEELLVEISDLKSRRIEAERDGAAEDYGALLRAHVPPADDIARARVSSHIPRLDLVLLGMGADGHTASLFPGTAALDERERLVVRNEVPQLDTHRVTMTFPLINAARERWFLVSGADKAAAFARVRAGELPAGRIHDATWYVDLAVIGT
jgi:6-phosphogluconolactonase